MQEYAAELKYFEQLWAKRAQGPVDHSPELWDERAMRWIEKLNGDLGKSARAARIRATAQALQERGLLQEDHSVADVGCGPGLFVLEFAKYVRSAVGIDYSRRFVDYARARSIQDGFLNAQFLQRDFLTLDVEQEGLAGSFDLVFTCLTPAATGSGCLEKLMRMSRGWCCNISIVHAGDSLAERVMQDVFGQELRPRWDGRGFYTLWNLLWLSGYCPEIFYYNDIRDETVTPDRRWAKKLAVYCGKRNPEDIDRVGAYLDRLGATPRHSTSRYGTILWDVNRKDRR